MEEEAKALSIPHRKKQKDNRSQVMGIAEEDMTLLSEVVTEVAEKTSGKITTRKTNWKDSITMKVNYLVQTIAEVCDTM